MCVPKNLRAVAQHAAGGSFNANAPLSVTMQSTLSAHEMMNEQRAQPTAA